MSTEEFNNLWTANSPTVTLPVHIDAIDQGREDFSVYDQWVDGYDANVTGRETIAIIPRGTGILEITDLVQREAQAVGLGPLRRRLTTCRPSWRTCAPRTVRSQP